MTEPVRAVPTTAVPAQPSLEILAAPTAGGNPAVAALRASQNMVVSLLGPEDEVGLPQGSVEVGGMVFQVSSLRGRRVMVSAARRELARKLLAADLPPSGWGDESSPADRRWRARRQMKRQAELVRLRALLEP